MTDPNPLKELAERVAALEQRWKIYEVHAQALGAQLGRIEALEQRWKIYEVHAQALEALHARMEALEYTVFHWRRVPGK